MPRTHATHRRSPSILRPTPVAVALSLALAALSGPALAQNTEKQLSDVVVTAAGFEQKIADAPASITVITREELQSRPYTSLLDAVRGVEGVDIGADNDKTGRGAIRIRGMGADYTLVLIDGKRQNSVGSLGPNDFEGLQSSFLPPLDMIERIEIIRGPMSTLYGSDALGGVVNIITRKMPDRWIGSASFSRTRQSDSDFGDDRTVDFTVQGPLLPGTLGIGVHGSHYNSGASDPQYAPVTDPVGVQHTRTLGFGGGGRTVENSNWSGGVRLTFTPNVQHDIVLDLDTSRQKYANSASQLGTFDSYGAVLRPTAATGINQPRVGYYSDQRYERDQWSLSHTGRWDFGRSEVSLAYNKTENLGRTLPFTTEERAALQTLWNTACSNAGGPAHANGNCRPTGAGSQGNTDTAKLAFMQANLMPAQLAEFMALLPRPHRVMETRQYTLDGKLELPFERHFVVVGGQYIDAEHEDGVFAMRGGAFQRGTVQPHRQWAVFFEDNWSPIDSLTLTAGLRHDRHNMFGGNTTPRLYAVWNTAPGWTVKGGVSTGYKTPKTDQLFPGVIGFGGQGVSPWAGNPDLKPETSVSSEIAAYFDSGTGKSINITLFQNRFKDYIQNITLANCETAAGGGNPGVDCVDIGTGWASNGITTVQYRQNIAKAEIKGIELAGRYDFGRGVSLRANYTYTDTEQKSGTQKGRPLGGNNGKHLLNATLDWQVTSKFQTYLSMEAESKRYRSWDTNTDRPLYWEAYRVFHLGARYNVSNHLSLNARVNNLLDRDFTTYKTTFATADGGLTYTPTFRDDYRTKHKRRNLWVSANLKF